MFIMEAAQKFLAADFVKTPLRSNGYLVVVQFEFSF